MPRPVRRSTMSRRFPVVMGSQFQTPDVLNNLDFETDLHPLLDFGLNYPPQCTWDGTKAYHGTHSIKVPITPNAGDSGLQTCLQLPQDYDHLYFRWYFNITGKTDTVHKYWRCYDHGFTNGCGGLWITSGNPGFSLCFDAEQMSVQFPAGPTDSIYDGNWHYVEFDFQRNGTAPDGSTWPNFGLYVDGSQITHADGIVGGGNGTAYWKTNRFYAGERDNSFSTGIGIIEIMAVVNGGNTQTYQENMDWISISTKGRIGP